MRAIRYAALTLALLSAPLSARKETPPPAQPPMPTGYDDPGPKPVNVLPAITADLRKTLTDPYSVRDFQLCEPHATKPVYNSYGEGVWLRSQWMISFSLNAKNRMGGYAGRTGFLASYTDGKLESVSSMSDYADTNEKVVGETVDCPRVQDAEIQKLLSN